MKKPKIDFFSLDVEGAELSILRNLPFEQIDIKLMLVEVSNGDEETITDLMRKKGYTIYKQTTLDVLYVKQ